MKKQVQAFLFIVLGIVAIAGLTLSNQIQAMTDAASGLSYSVDQFQIHKVDLDNKSLEVKINANFENPSHTPIPLSDLAIRLNIPNEKGEWFQLSESIPTGAFTIAPGSTVQPLKFQAPIAKEFTTILPTLFTGKSQSIMVQVFPQIKGRNLEPVSAIVDVNLGSALENFLSDKLGLGYTNNEKVAKFDGKEFEHLFPTHALKGTDPIISSGSVYRTLDEMERVVKDTLYQTTKVAQVLKEDNLEDTLHNVFDFANDYFTYKEDEEGVEQIREPARAFKDRFEGVDCDCFSVLISSILTNLGIRHKFRMAAYEGGNYQHVYVVVPAQTWP